MYWVRTIDVFFSDGKSQKYLYLMCDSFEEFTEDTIGIVGAPLVWAALTGKMKKVETHEKAKKEFKPLKFERNPHSSPSVKSVMKELGAVVSATVTENLYGMGNEEGMREVRELIINRKVGKKFHIAQTNMPGYESLFDGTINKKINSVVEMNHDYALAYCDIASAYYENHDYDMAIENYSRAIEIDPESYETYYHRGGNYFMKGNFDSAFDDITQYLKMYPSNKTAKDLLQRIINKKDVSKNET